MELQVDDLKTAIEKEHPIRLCAGNDGKGRHCVFSLKVDLLDPAKSVYIIHDADDKITEFATFDEAAKFYLEQ
jgi:hypothetical protein